MPVLPGNGNSNISNHYVFNDTDLTTGENYLYRIEQVDYDGQSNYSKIITVRAGSSNDQWTIYPNPMQNQITIHSQKLLQNLEGSIELIDNNGKIVFSENHLFLDENIFKINIGDIPSGVYSLLIRNGNGEVLLIKRMVCD